MSRLRIDKFLADSGLGTRSQVKQLIKKGLITVNGKVATDSALKIDTADFVCCKGEPVSYSQYTYLMLNKPSGVVSATRDRAEKTVIQLLTPPYSNMELFPVGRLDKDTVGLIILTNDGDFAHKTLSPKKHVAKTYYVEAEGCFSPDIAKRFKDGVTLGDGYLCKAAELNIICLDESCIKADLTVTEGKFHQIKRMFATEDGRVTYLKRTAFGEIVLDSEDLLPQGSFRELNKKELEYINCLKQEN